MTVPFSPNSEATVLGCMLVSPSALAYALDRLTVADFHSPDNVRTFDAIELLAREGTVIDAGLAASALGVKPTLMHDLAELAGMFPIRSVRDHAAIVAEKAAFRRALAFCDSVTEAVHAEKTDLLDELLADPFSFVLPDTGKGPAPVEASSLADEEHQIDFVIPGLLARHEVAMWVGEPGFGKSTLLRQIAVCAASGLHPFSRVRVPRRRVLIVDCQDSRATAGLALREMLAHAGDRYSGQLWVELRPQGIDLSTPRHQRWLDQAVSAVDAELVILGPLYNMVRGAPNRSKQSEETAELAMNALTDLMVRRDCALMIEAHAPHGDEMRVRGSKLWEDFPDFGFGLIPEGSDPREAKVRRFRGDRHSGRNWPNRYIEGHTWPWESSSG